MQGNNQTRTHLFLVFVLSFWGAALCSLQAVPVTFHYQGHIIVSGEAYEGMGYFKFALQQCEKRDMETTVRGPFKGA